MRVFLAGASGVIGQRLVPLLVRAGHKVVGTTHSHEKAGLLRSLGAEPVVGGCVRRGSGGTRRQRHEAGRRHPPAHQSALRAGHPAV